MHQDHNIPWKTISKHFAVRQVHHPERIRASFGDKAMDFCPLDKPNQASELKYLSDSIIKTIKEFATTERKKYPETFHIEEFGKLYSDELLDSQSAENLAMGYTSPCHLTKEIQSVDYWIRAANRSREKYPDHYQNPIYDTNNMDLASAIKYLLIKNEMAPLLMMSQYEATPLRCLYVIHWGHSFGWSRLMEYALSAYIYINILGEFPDLCKNSKYKKLCGYESLTRHLTASCDGDTQILLHLPFLLPPVEERKDRWTVDDISRDIFSDLGRLKDYLRVCFEALYRSEMLARECGIDIDWEGEIASCLRNFNVPLFHIQSEENGVMSYRISYKNPKQDVIDE